MSNPNHQVTWRSTRPEFTIEFLRATSNSRCYHESWYAITSRRPLDGDDLKALDSCGLLGMGQAFYLEKTETITDTVPPITIDQRTGEVINGLIPFAWNGQPVTNMNEYIYHRYIVRRICDSGD